MVYIGSRGGLRRRSIVNDMPPRPFEVHTYGSNGEGVRRQKDVEIQQMWRCVCRRARIYLSGDGAIVINGATSSHIQDTARRMPTVAKPTNSSVSMSLISQHGCGTTWLGPSSRLCCNTTYVPDVFGPHSAMSGLTNHRARGTAETIRIQKYQPQ